MVSTERTAFGFRIMGSGQYLPKRRLTSAEIDARFNWPEGTSEERYGLQARHVAGKGETSSFMAEMASREALAEAGLAPQDLDLIIGACGVMEQPIPSTAVLVQNRLGIGGSGIAAFDVNATCLSFVQALEVALQQIHLGLARRVLVFSADIASVGLDWDQPDTAAIFGDGAAAVVLEAGSSRRLSHRFRTWGEGQDICTLAGGGTRLGADQSPEARFFRMDGAQAFRKAARHMPAFLSALLGDAGCTLNDIDYIIPHQASGPALRHEIARLGIAPQKVVTVYGQVGNQIATSIPTALHAARRQGLLTAGTKALLVGSSAGISLGGMVVQF